MSHSSIISPLGNLPSEIGTRRLVGLHWHPAYRPVAHGRRLPDRHPQYAAAFAGALGYDDEQALSGNTRQRNPRKFHNDSLKRYFVEDNFGGYAISILSVQR